MGADGFEPGPLNFRRLSKLAVRSALDCDTTRSDISLVLGLMMDELRGCWFCARPNGVVGIEVRAGGGG